MKILGTFLHFFVHKKKSAVFLFTKEAGLHISTVALKKELFNLKVTWKLLIFPDGEFTKSNFFIKVYFVADMICIEGDTLALRGELELDL